MENLEVSGKTVEEALQHALEQLGVTRDEVEVTVLSEGRSGILGLGAEEAKIRVRLLSPPPEGQDDLAEKAKSVLETLLATMEVNASIVRYSQPLFAEGQEATPIAFNIEGEDLGILIGRRGQTLASLEYIVRLIVTHQTQSFVPIFIDVEGYRQRRYEALQALARRVAEQVAAKRTQFTLEPMPAYERRIIHLTLADHPRVTTQSVGTGETRKVVIMPKKKAS